MQTYLHEYFLSVCGNRSPPTSKDAKKNRKFGFSVSTYPDTPDSHDGILMRPVTRIGESSRLRVS